VGAAVREALVKSTDQVKAVKRWTRVLQTELCSSIIRPVASGYVRRTKNPEVIVAAPARHPSS